MSSEASSVSQDTVMQADISELYARVDINKKKKRNSDSSGSPSTETPVPVQYSTETGVPVQYSTETPVPVPAPRRMMGDRGRQEEEEGT